jgi:hypothetical protein
VLALFSLVGIFVPGSWRTLFALIQLAADCGMMWFLLGGVMEFTASRQRADLAERASTRRLVNVFLLCIATLIGFAARSAGDAAGGLAIVLVLSLVVLMVMILHLIHRVKNEVAS